MSRLIDDHNLPKLMPYRLPFTDLQFVPVAPHPGAFGVKRKHDHHTGVDLYSTHSTLVRPIESGRVVEIMEFTGLNAEPPSPWWNRTQAVLVEGRTGVILYGEVSSRWYRRTSDGQFPKEYVPYFEDDEVKDVLTPTNHSHINVGDEVVAGITPIGCIVPVLKKVKESTISRFMLHVELLAHGRRTDAGIWEHGQSQPEWLFDPTPMLIQAK